MAKDETRYAYSVARTRVLETRLLDRTKIERLVDARDADEALRALQETEYAPLVAQVKSPFDYETVLSGELGRVRDLILTFAPDPELVTVFYRRYDFHNVRVLLKAALREVETPLSGLSRIGTIAVESLRDLVRDEVSRKDSEAESVAAPAAFGLPDSDPVPPVVKRAVREAVRAFRGSGDPQVVDLVVDRAAQEHYLEVAASHDAEFLTGYLARLADLTNLKTYLRVRRMGRDAAFLRSVLVPGGLVPAEVYAQALQGPADAILADFRRTVYADVAEEGLKAAEKTGRLTRLETLTWGFLMDYLRGAKHIHTDYPALLAYAMAKEAETRLLRLIFVGKLNGLSREKIAERLFDTYV